MDMLESAGKANRKNSVTGNQIRERIKQVSAELEIWQARFLPSLKAFESELEGDPTRSDLPGVTEHKILDLEQRIVLLQNLLAEYNTKVMAAVPISGGAQAEALGIAVKTLGGLQRMRKKYHAALTQQSAHKRFSLYSRPEDSFHLSERTTADVEREVMVVDEKVLEEKVLQYDRLISNYKLAIAAANLADYKISSLVYLFEEE